ncbi:hypothetical protein BGX26_012683, partial [Mortierella sp. AD094]
MSALIPLKIPEILSLVANHLERRQVVTCLRVCKAWHKSLLPIVWHSVILKGQDGVHNMKDPSEISLHRHRQFIFRLESYLSFMNLDTTFPNLHTLVLALVYRGSQLESSHMELFAMNPSLVNITISGEFLGDIDAEFWKAMSSLPQLRILKALFLPPGIDEIEAFWNVCSKLEEATFRETIFPTNYIQSLELSFPRMRKLELDACDLDDYKEQLEFVRRCPNLEELSWTVDHANTEVDNFSSEVKQGGWPRLARLRIQKGRS